MKLLSLNSSSREEQQVVSCCLIQPPAFVLKDCDWIRFSSSSCVFLAVLSHPVSSRRDTSAAADLWNYVLTYCCIKNSDGSTIHPNHSSSSRFLAGPIILNSLGRLKSSCLANPERCRKESSNHFHKRESVVSSCRILDGGREVQI
jgi:hypothetical protein